ncbi:DUF4186 domain-containing protein [Tranquillimonas alkanivorans]|uniref:DUF4186 domain-containing protein n=1 Tax=Tranquillimonas alkanivorans TaxID=441119 RepID=A0A1I5NSL1_9RHOB|nr:DUF4186 domain-containing protein [Tranquillimonas alkanivorans]SFP24805.1 protein of unknown function [Tranquillimonas alkanivorans]
MRPDAENLDRLSRSRFRSRFRMGQRERAYLETKGAGIIRSHADDFIAQRLAPAMPKNDGRQTPMRGHPVFIAQHATATCCRSCLEKWHGIRRGREMTEEERRQVVALIMHWIARDAGGD